MQIQTVLGPVSPDELGFCQCHEHLWLAPGQSARINPDLCIDDFDSSLRELGMYRAAGGRALVDAQPVGCGRDALQLAKLSQGSGVHIVASTGFHKMCFYPQGHWIFSLDADRLARLFCSELREGMYTLCDSTRPAQRTGHRAGQIKTALDAGSLTPQYEKLFSSAAHAAVETGAPLMVHIEADSRPIALADRLARQGVPPGRMIFCHMDRSVADLAVHKELCARGIFLEYDTIARPKYHDDMREAAIILQMLEAGYERQLLASLDVTRARMVCYGGGVGLAYIRGRFLDCLRGYGVGEGALHSLFVENPARVLAVAG